MWTNLEWCKDYSTYQISHHWRYNPWLHTNIFINGPNWALVNIYQQLQAYSFRNGVLYFQDRIVVLDDKELQSRLNAPVVGHPSWAKTLDIVARTFYWLILYQYIHRYVDGCKLCQHSNSMCYSQYGLL